MNKPLQIGDLTAPIPVIQGGMGVGISLSGLAGAVAKAGGIGIISTAQIGFRKEEYSTDPLAANLEAIGEEIGKAKAVAEGVSLPTSIPITKVFSFIASIFLFCVLDFIIDTSLYNKIFTNLPVSSLIVL